MCWYLHLKLWFLPDLEGKLGQIPHLWSRILFSQVLSACGLWTRSNQPYKVCLRLTFSSALCCPTSCLAYSHNPLSRTIVGVTVGHVGQKKSKLAGNYWASIGAACHIFHTSYPRMCKHMSILQPCSAAPCSSVQVFKSLRKRFLFFIQQLNCFLFYI